MAVLGQVPAQGVDALRPLPHQQVADPEHNSVRLLCLLLHRHKAHPRPLRRFADRLSIRHVILLPLDKGLHISGWDQPHRVAQLAKLPRPVVRPPTSLQRHKTGRLPREKLEHLGPHQALAEHHPAGRIGPVRLKYPLRNIKPYRASLAHGRLLWWLLNTITLAHRCRRGASTPSRCRALPRPLETRAVSRQLCRGVSSLYCGYNPMSEMGCSGKSGRVAVAAQYRAPLICRICELPHKAEALSGLNFSPTCIVMTMPFCRKVPRMRHLSMRVALAIAGAAII